MTHQLPKAGTIRAKPNVLTTSIKSPAPDEVIDGERSPNTYRSSLNNSGFGTHYANQLGGKVGMVIV